MGRLIALAVVLAPLLGAAASDKVAAEIDAKILRDAIRNNHSRTLERALVSPELLGVIADDGKTMLMAAAADDNTGLLSMLLDAGADPDDVNDRGGTALMYAAANGAPGCVRLLLESGADIDARADNGWTAVTLASAKGHLDVVALLLGRGADPNVPDVFGWTPLMRAVQNHRLDVVRELLHSPLVDAERINSQGRNALHVAMEYGFCDIARALSKAGIDPQSQDFGNRTAVELAPGNDDCLSD